MREGQRTPGEAGWRQGQGQRRQCWQLAGAVRWGFAAGGWCMRVLYISEAAMLLCSVGTGMIASWALLWS